MFHSNRFRISHEALSNEVRLIVLMMKVANRLNSKQLQNHTLQVEYGLRVRYDRIKNINFKMIQNKNDVLPPL